MNLPASAKPAVLGAIGGAIVAMVIGFAWGGWVTAGTAEKMAAQSAETAVVEAFTPLCVAEAEQHPEQRAALTKESYWQRDAFVVKAGWVDDVGEKYRSAVATACASRVVEAADEKGTTKPAG